MDMRTFPSQTANGIESRSFNRRLSSSRVASRGGVVAVDGGPSSDFKNLNALVVSFPSSLMSVKMFDFDT